MWRYQSGFTVGDPLLPDEFCYRVRDVVEYFLGNLSHGLLLCGWIGVIGAEKNGGVVVWPVSPEQVPARKKRWVRGVISENSVQ